MTDYTTRTPCDGDAPSAPQEAPEAPAPNADTPPESDARSGQGVASYDERDEEVVGRVTPRDLPLGRTVVQAALDEVRAHEAAAWSECRTLAGARERETLADAIRRVVTSRDDALRAARATSANRNDAEIAERLFRNSIAEALGCSPDDDLVAVARRRSEYRLPDAPRLPTPHALGVLELLAEVGMPTGIEYDADVTVAWLCGALAEARRGGAR